MPKVSEEHMEARRQQIVDAAVACFARSGIHGTSLDDIRKEADLSRGAVYHYFKSKEDIIEALRERSKSEDAEIFGEIVDEDSDIPLWVRSMELGIKRNLGGENNTDARVALFLWAEAALNERVLRSQEDLFKPWIEKLPVLIKESQDAGDVNPDLDPKAITRVLSALAIGVSTQLAWDPKSVDVDPLIEVLRTLFTGEFWLGTKGKASAARSGKKG